MIETTMKVIAKSFLPTIFSKETSYWIWKMENGIDENLSPTGEFVGGQGHPWGGSKGRGGKEGGRKGKAQKGGR